MAIYPEQKRVFLLGASGTIGRATCRALARRGHQVVALIRSQSKAACEASAQIQGAEWRVGDVTDPSSLVRDGFRGERFDALVSCLASRTGTPDDAWAIDHTAHSNALAAAKTAGVSHVVLVSAICVQKPSLAFQHAKLAFEAELVRSGIAYSIVRPTAFFKSLSGQVERVKRGKPFLVFGNGELTACKPISDEDLADYLVDCLDDESLRNRILPIGGPGGAITPRQQGEALFSLLDREPRFRQVPLALLDLVIATLGTLGHFSTTLARKAELARIGRYYATESMLVWDRRNGRYDADATPHTGSDTLFDFYAGLLKNNVSIDLGDHAVF